MREMGMETAMGKATGNEPLEISSNEGFYIGDVCYVLPGSIYHGIWQERYDFENGLIRVSGEDVEEDEPGSAFAVAGTLYGDGIYWDEHGNEYPVDAGVIGLVPLELATEYEERTGFKPGLIVEMPGTAIFETAYGVFDITLPDGGRIHINTRGCEDDMDYETDCETDDTDEDYEEDRS